MSDNSFLPGDYKAPPSNSKYFKYVEGDNKIRILSKAIIGFEYWTTENKPVRSKEQFKETPNIKTNKDGSTKINHFWAFVIFNYNTKRLEIMEVTQRSIQDEIVAYHGNEAWGDPKKYNITINKTGQGLETKYKVMAEPPIEPPHPKILELFNNTTIALEKLYSGGDPFEATQAPVSEEKVITYEQPEVEPNAPQTPVSEQKSDTVDTNGIKIENIPF